MAYRVPENRPIGTVVQGMQFPSRDASMALLYNFAVTAGINKMTPGTAQAWSRYLQDYYDANLKSTYDTIYDMSNSLTRAVMVYSHWLAGQNQYVLEDAAEWARIYTPETSLVFEVSDDSYSLSNCRDFAPETQEMSTEQIQFLNTLCPVKLKTLITENNKKFQWSKVGHIDILEVVIAQAVYRIISSFNACVAYLA